jgi:tRNA(Ile)-lysidine synthase
MLAEVRALIRREGMLRPGEPVWVAVSGGVDSMVLLHVLRELGHPCHVAHVDHGLRGAESDADRQFVEEQAQNQGLPFRSVRVDPMAAAEGISVQMAARELRHAWFRELLHEGPHAMALGHHRDDAVETFLLNLLRGIGAHGWGGIAPVTTLPEGRICRPLLGVDRARIMHYAGANHIPFREDPSNTDPKYLRNRVRSELLPLMEALRPGARRTLARGTDLLNEMAAATDRHLDHEAEGLTPDGQGVLRIPLERLRNSAAPRMLLMRLLSGLEPHPDLVGQLLDAVHQRSTGARFHAGGGRITLERNMLVVDRVPDGFPTFTIFGAGAKPGAAGPFTWELCSVAEVELGQGMNTAWLDLDKLEFPLQLRPWRTGDRMRPVGLVGSKLISDILIDAHVPYNAKAGSYVLVSGTEIVWLVGHRVAEGFPPGKATHKVLRLSFQG